jgi:hypothetical protein
VPHVSHLSPKNDEIDETIGSQPDAGFRLRRRKIPRTLGRGEHVQGVIRTALAIALLFSAAGLMVRSYIRLVEHARS